MAKPTAEQFLELVRRSGLVEALPLEGMVRAVQERSGGRVLEDVDALAAAFVDARLLTVWQSENLLKGRYKRFFLKQRQYKLLRQLGSGGMSTVYLAEHTLMKRLVAIKVLPKDRSTNDETSYLARFHREAQAIAAMDHHNIVRAYDIDNDGDVHFIVMEYVEGRDLQSIVRKHGPMDCVTAAGYIRQAAEGLEHAHRCGLIHRDVKPANFLVDLHGVVKLLDLGLARFTGEQTASLTIAYSENVLGTADYLAPEQAIDSHGVDARADIYSLGCSLYFLLVGTSPFPNGTLPQRLMKHQKSTPPDIRLQRSDVPDDFVAICMKMMAKKPEARYQSAAEVARALDEWLSVHGRPGEETPPGNVAPASGEAAGATAGDSSLVRRVVLRSTPIKQAAAWDGEPFGVAATAPGSSPRLGATASLTLKPAPAGSAPASNAADSNAAEPEASRGSSVVGRHRPPSGSGRPIPVAQPSDENDVLGDLFSDSVVPLGRRVAPVKVASNEELIAYRNRRNAIPIWLWIAIGAGCVLAAILMGLTAWLSH